MHFLKKIKKLIPLIAPPILINSYNDRKSNPNRYAKANALARDNFNQEFEVLEFSLISADSPFELKWGWWSRVYEYELAISELKKLGADVTSEIHNTCWGYHGSHILFKRELESISQHVTNSDLLESDVENTVTHDLRNPVPEDWVGKFDFVVNISTIEEIPFSHVQIIENLLKMVKPQGYLVATFDIPGMQLNEVEKLLDMNIKEVENVLRGDNSPYQMNEYSDLRVGYFVLKKIK